MFFKNMNTTDVILVSMNSFYNSVDLCNGPRCTPIVFPREDLGCIANS